MFDSELRVVKQKLLTPFAQKLTVSANVLTSLGFFIGLMSVICAWQGYYWLTLIGWLLNRLIDGLDGEVARIRGRQSDWRGYLDILADFVIYSLLPLGLFMSNPSVSGGFAMGFMLASFYVNAASWMYLSVLLEKRQVNQDVRSVIMPKGLIEGTETIIFYCLFIAFPTLLPWLFALMTLLVVVTIFQRLSWAESVLS
jgi:phosphatidylglycerophosphate synthase